MTFESIECQVVGLPPIVIELLPKGSHYAIEDSDGWINRFSVENDGSIYMSNNHYVMVGCTLEKQA